MLRHRNPWAVGDQRKLFDIFEVNLKHDDTYLYLAAVDGLMSLVDVHHVTVLPLLCRRFVEMKTDGKITSLIFPKIICFLNRLKKRSLKYFLTALSFFKICPRLKFVNHINWLNIPVKSYKCKESNKYEIWHSGRLKELN